MFEKLAKTVAYVTQLLGIEKIPQKDGKVNFTDEQRAKLSDSLGSKLTEDMIAAIEKEIATISKNSKEDLEAAKKEILAVMEEAGFTEEEKEEVLNAGSTEELNVNEKLKAMHSNIIQLKSSLAEQEKTIKKLIAEPETEAQNIIQMAVNQKFKHSATHLFGSANSYDAFADRPWNERFRDGGQATDFASDIHAPILKGDLQNFIRLNPGAIDSLFDDFDELPSDWDEINGIADQYATASVLPSSLLQGRSKGWNPKGKIKIATEQLKVYAKKIDIELNGQDLQKLENTWIAAVKDLDGSHPWKMSFIFWVVAELAKKAKVDERQAMINGIYVQTPDGDEFTGDHLSSQNGLRWFWWYHANITKKYTPFAVGAPTELGFTDYIRMLIEMIPENERKESGWEIQLSQKWMKAYQKDAGELYKLTFKDDLGKQEYPLTHPIDYPNFKFQPIKDMTNTDFIGFIHSKNVVKLNFRPAEKTALTLTHEKRNTLLFGDYKSGIGIGTVGMKANDNEPADFTKQLIYSNDQPIFEPDRKIVVWDDESGILKLNYTTVKVQEDWKTDITNIAPLEDDMPFNIDLKGQVIKIVGDTKLANNKYVKNNANLLLTGSADFDLKSGGTLTLFARPDGKFVELSRTSQPDNPNTAEVDFTDEGVIDANEGVQFNYVAANSETDTLGEILNGVDGKIITITKTLATTGELTIATVSGKISVATTAVLDSQNDTISFVKSGGMWYEISRDIS